MCQAFSTLAVSIGFSIYLSWRVGLVTSIFVPLILLGTSFETKLLNKQLTGDNLANEIASKV